jgi:hypothetical protein
MRGDYMEIRALILWKDGVFTLNDMSCEGGINEAEQLCRALIRHEGDDPRYVAKEIELFAVNGRVIKSVYNGRKSDER